MTVLRFLRLPLETALWFIHKFCNAKHIFKLDVAAVSVFHVLLLTLIYFRDRAKPFVRNVKKAVQQPL